MLHSDSLPTILSVSLSAHGVILLPAPEPSLGYPTSFPGSSCQSVLSAEELVSLEATLIPEMGAKGQMLLSPVFLMDHSWRSFAGASVELQVSTFIAFSFFFCVTGPACSLLLSEITSPVNLLHPCSHSSLYLGEEIVGQMLSWIDRLPTYELAGSCHCRRKAVRQCVSCIIYKAFFLSVGLESNHAFIFNYCS